MIGSIHSRRLITAVLASVLAFVLAACGGGTQRAGGGSDGEKAVTIGYVAWDECIASSNLWKELLEQQGYTVVLEQLEPKAVYAGVAQGDLDLFMCGVPKTHEDYWNEFGGDFKSVAQWYDTLTQGLAVPDYVVAETINDLAGRGEEFGGEIIGIEAGSGLMQDLEENAVNDYDLSGYKVVGGSTGIMLAALDRALSRKEPIVVTLWDPHWALGTYKVRILEDPKKSFGDGDAYNVIASKKAQEKSELIDQISRFHMTQEQLLTLELAINQAGKNLGMNDIGQDKKRDGVRAWINKNEAVVDGWTKGS